MKVSFINEIANLCDRVGADIDVVASGIGQDPRIGGPYLRPGLGYVGSCFPKDVRALNFLFNANGHNFELLQAVIGVNNRQRLLPMLALREKFGPLHGIRVAILGVSFKPETDDTREAPALDLVTLLLEEGAEVRVYGPWANVSSVLPSAAVACESALTALDGAQAAVVERLRAKFPDYQFQAGDLSREPIPGKWDVILMVHVDGRIHGEDSMKAMTTIKEAMKPTSNFLASASHPDEKSWVPHVEHHSEKDFTKVFPIKWIHRPVHKFGGDLLLSISGPPHPTRDAVSLVDLT